MAKNANDTTGVESSDDHNELARQTIKLGAKRRAYGVEDWAEEHNLDPDHIRHALIYEAFTDETPQVHLDDIVDRDEIPGEYPLRDLPAIYIDKVAAAAAHINNWTDQCAGEYITANRIDRDEIEYQGGDA